MKIAGDVGGSNTRVSVDGNRSIFNSSFVRADDSINVLRDGVNPLEDVIIETPDEKVRVIRGEQMGKYTLKPTTCGNDTLKSQFDGTIYNLLIGICRNLGDNLAIVNPDVLMCLPPEETYGPAAENFKKKLGRRYRVRSTVFPDMVFSLDFDSTKIKVASEGTIALAALQNPAMLINGYSIIIDMGYRSTDISIMLSGRIIGGAYKSDPTGGINLLSQVEAAMSRNGKFLAPEEVKQLLATGAYWNDTTTYLPLVDTAKKNYAGTLYQLCVDTGSLASINMQAVRNIVTIGRPFIKREGQLSLAEHLVSYFPNSPALVEFASDINPELVNLIGCERALGIKCASA